MERGARLVAHGLMPLAGLKPSVTLQPAPEDDTPVGTLAA